MSRPHGNKNQPKRALIALLEEKFPGYNAVLSMAEMANDQENDQAFRFKAHAEVAQYQESKRKSVEVKSQTDVRYVIDTNPMSPDEWQNKYAGHGNPSPDHNTH